MVEQLDQLEVCLPFSKLLAGISILAVFQNLKWNSNKTSLILVLNIITWENLSFNLSWEKDSVLSSVLPRYLLEIPTFSKNTLVLNLL